MGVKRSVLNQGSGTVKPEKGDTVRLEYTGFLYDASQSANYHRGKQFDASKDHGGVFETPIGIERVIKGWDVGIMEMVVGEESILTISSDYAYGERGFPNIIEPNSRLVFDVKLLSIARNGEVISESFPDIKVDQVE